MGALHISLRRRCSECPRDTPGVLSIRTERAKSGWGSVQRSGKGGRGPPGLLSLWRIGRLSRRSHAAGPRDRRAGKNRSFRFLTLGHMDTYPFGRPCNGDPSGHRPRACSASRRRVQETSLADVTPVARKRAAMTTLSPRGLSEGPGVRDGGPQGCAVFFSSGRNDGQALTAGCISGDQRNTVPL
jgi:hypothetical protein